MALLRLLTIHLFAAIAIWLSTYIVGLDLFLSLVYIIIISLEISNLKKEPLGIKGLVAILWIGIPLSLSLMTSLRLSSLAIFILEFWFTPLIPLLSLFPYMLGTGKPLYYYILICLPGVLAIHFILLTRNKAKIK